MDSDGIVWVQVGLWGLLLTIGIGSYIYRTYRIGYRPIQVEQEEPNTI